MTIGSDPHRALSASGGQVGQGEVRRQGGEGTGVVACELDVDTAHLVSEGCVDTGDFDRNAIPALSEAEFARRVGGRFAYHRLIPDGCEEVPECYFWLNDYRQKGHSRDYPRPA